MSYLFDLVKSLDEDELGQLRKLELTGKEQFVRNEYANHVQEEKFSESTLPAKLCVTKSHFDKINSVLLDKALTLFAGSELKNKLDFLVNKQLTELTLHELKVTEKQLNKQEDKAALKEFYAEAFRITIIFNFNNFPVEHIEYYCKCCIQLLNQNEEAEKYQMLAKRQEVLIRYYYPRKDGVAKREKLLKELLRWQIELKDRKLFEAEVGINLAFSSYYETTEPKKGLYYLQEADKAARKVYDKIADRDKAFLLAMMATQMIDIGLYREGIGKYEELFSKFPHLAAVRVFHPFQYVFGLLILKDFKAAGAAMEKYLQPFLKNENARNYHFDILRLYAMYHLLNLETEKAGNYLQRILQFGKEDFTSLGDVLFRLVHNVYCAQTGDYVLAADVLKKNMKYIDSKNEIEGMSAYKKLFLDLGKVIRFKSKGNTLNASFSPDKIETGVGLARLYQDLIKLPLQN